MEKLSTLSKENETKLLEKNFIQTIGHDSGMHQAYEWSNDTFKLGLYYDRGYFDCSIISKKDPSNSMGLIRLLRKIKNDVNFYDKELAEANLWNTLTCDQYIELMLKHYDQIQDYFNSN